MDNIKALLDTLLEPLGDYAPKIRHFIIDYHDTGGTFMHHSAISTVPDGMANMDIVYGLVSPFRDAGYLIDGVCELLDGYTEAELSVLADKNPIEAAKHIRWLYLDPAAL